MTIVTQLLCLEPAQPPRFILRQSPLPTPSKTEVLVRVEACSINPIDVKRSQGYGKKLLGLKGAGRFPLLLGNDIAGIVEKVGPSVRGLRPGDRVFGLIPTGKTGAHSTHVIVRENLLLPAVSHMSAVELSAFPYCFTTVWLALQGAGISETNAKGLRIFIHGASGGLGQLATQLLTLWGAQVTAICRTQNIELCRTAGAQQIWDRTKQDLANLPNDFDAGLNFGSWFDEETLIGRLKTGALGYATALHPLLSNVDQFGLVRGLLISKGIKKRMNSLAKAKGARYQWTIFKPDALALSALHEYLDRKLLALPVGIAVPFEVANLAFDHVALQKPGRAVLVTSPRLAEN